MKTALVFCLVLLLLGCAVPQEKKPEQKNNNLLEEVSTMKLTSPTFVDGGKIPSLYTCDGENISPPLNISEVPAAAKSLVLIMDDPDALPVAGKVWDHWVVFNIPAETKEIAAGKNPSGVMGKNTQGVNSYGGPCPPDREHRYFFKLYALDTMLELQEGATKAEVEKAMHKQILEQVELVGRYVRK